jgi:ferric-dicitrate binding protein FerR (iron transport regulator)
VQLTGEAYFEVASLTSRQVGTGSKGGSHKVPFIVKINTPSGNGGQIEVLGTHFNVNAYNNEAEIKATLLEGSIKITKDAASAILKPGQQASLSQTSQKSNAIPVRTANTEQAVAWKNGYFRFKETGIRELMRQVERWYDVDVEFRTDHTDQYYTGMVSRSQNISALLQTLELTGTVHFQIDNNPEKGKQGKIIVLP